MDVSTALGLLAASQPTKIFVEKTLGPTFEYLGTTLRDSLASKFQRNVETALTRAAEKASSSGRDLNEIPLRTAMPLLEGASREDDATLAEMWSSLIAAAATSSGNTEVPPAFPRILASLSPFDARVLAKFAEPTIRRLSQEHLIQDFRADATRARVNEAIDILQSQGLCHRATPADSTSSSRRYELRRDDPLGAKVPFVELTSLGRRFLAACAERESPGSSNEMS